MYSGSFEIDLDSQTISTVEPRQSDFVYDITGFLPDKCPGGCFRFAIISIVDTVFEIELTLENPIAIQAYDLRVVYLDTFNKTVLNPDSYTDFMGTPINGIFPFTAFMKESPERAFPIGPGAIDTETLFLDFPSGLSSLVSYAITASLPSNAGEPYEIGGMSQSGMLTPSGGSATISCSVDDHQDDVSSVFLDAILFTGTPVEMLPVGSSVFEVEISNTEGAPIGAYNQLMMALSPNAQNISTYNYVEISVSNEAKTIYVDDSYVGPPYDGTIDHPFNTIQEALLIGNAGDEIHVDDSGNQYVGPIALVDGVLLKSINWDTSDGDAQATIHTDFAISCVLGADDASIDGFEIDGGLHGIECDGTSPEIINCRITNCSGRDTCGIWLHDGSYAHIDNVEIFALRKSDHFAIFGIFVEDCNAVADKKVVIEHSSISDFPSESWDFSYGIYVKKSSGTIINDCEISDLRGGEWSHSYGIVLSQSHDSTVSFCTIDNISGTGNSYSGGIKLTCSLDVNIEHCIVHDITGIDSSNTHGMYIYCSGGAQVTNSLVYKISNKFYETVCGISILNSPDVKITNNVVYRVFKIEEG
jgi:hypothetical protein